MLKHIPRTITISILLLFSMPIGIQHFSYLLSSYATDSSKSSAYFRNLMLEKIDRLSVLFTWLERIDYDLHLLAHDPGEKHKDVAVVDVGERSLQELGQFPFSRTVYKDLLVKLEAAGAKVVAFDITFPEHDERNETLVQLRGLRHEIEQIEGFDSLAVKEIDKKIFAIDADEDFATSLHKARLPVVLGFAFADSSRDVHISKEMSELILAYDVFRRQYSEAGMLLSKTGKLPVLSIVELMRSLNEKGSIGHFDPEIDPDNVIRRIPVVLEYDQRILASLSMRALAGYYGEEPVLDGSDGLWIKGITRDPAGLIHEGKMRFPVDPWGGFLVHFYGGNHIFPYTEFSDVVKGKLSDAELKERFAGKIVFVGVTAVGLKDLRANPFSPNYPGVEVHATVASNVLAQRFMVRDHRFFLIGYLFLWLCGALVAWMVFRFHPLRSFVTTAICVVAIQVISILVFYNHGIVVPTILPSLSCMSIFFIGVLYRYYTEEKEKKMVRASFSRYVSGAVVEEILKDQSKLKLGGQKKVLTVMFVDLVGFTKISEHMDVGFVTQLLNEYFTRMTNILLKNKGTLDKYMGDGIMCFWGAPLDIPEHAKLACATAIEMREELARINYEWKLKHGIAVENRIGVNTGEMSVGNMGSDQVFSYTVMGDNVNLGSRLEGVNTVYGTNIVMSEATVMAAGPGFLCRPLDRVQVKGKNDAVDIYELVGARAEREPEWVHAFRAGLKHYQAGEWDDAESAFGACLTLKPGDCPSQVFVDRIRDFRIVEPEEWGGIWKLSSK